MGRVNGEDRRQAGRLPPERTPWQRFALLRPGQEVRVINVSAGGALVESANRMIPGMRTELQLSGPARRVIRCRIERCRITGLDPICYEGAIVFEQVLKWS